jgi:alkylhydroperoxidase family enzyme
MSDIRQARRTLIERILKGAAKASAPDRRAAFDDSGLPVPLGTLVDKVARYPHRVTDDDIAAARGAGLSEDQIFEIVVCAAVGQATRQCDAAVTALEAAARKE